MIRYMHTSRESNDGTRGRCKPRQPWLSIRPCQPSRDFAGADIVDWQRDLQRTSVNTGPAQMSKSRKSGMVGEVTMVKERRCKLRLQSLSIRPADHRSSAYQCSHQVSQMGLTAHQRCHWARPNADWVWWECGALKVRKFIAASNYREKQTRARHRRRSVVSWLCT
ncbi:hypothetical protein DOTSEDRAFT_70710 [Dothistroma septosporum NZE10]|uniref:Uncharacterized protein n=1 Tax=Dothistroma septosporum (strain NZE10 / CBS 128990) TaxID=675120 RepID=N1PV58_DOTSN|nr:hypothetical protein DOTSEDRAFT_70710 [Dothistroma septosporum NZE10]